ncbi:MAG: enoyl-CoA hydratase/isomerase family protein [Proteobacteria bacterium]|nr:enoyl-CoA hydratase/isomerase family protein [Pseudomonadota bacterium]
MACVVITGAGDRAFCAGGDVRAIAESLRDPASTLSQDFFREEYVLNRRIHRYPKPYIALLDGVSMGGGFGVSLHGSHRVGTEKLSFAMPETTIGLFPDVGGTWFLTRCPGEVGTYLALTGRRVGLGDAVYCGYATHHVPRASLAALRESLFAAPPRDAAAADAALRPFVTAPETPSLAAVRTTIDRCFAFDSVERILAALEREGGEWANAIGHELGQKSPTSLKVTLRQLRGGTGLEIEDVLVREYRMTQRFMAAHDFAEGVRALLIDKDQKPRWRPPALDQIDTATVESYFAPLGARDLTFDQGGPRP